MAEASIARLPETVPFAAPWPGSHEMPRWNAGALVDAPTFTWKNWFAMLGPGPVDGRLGDRRRRMAGRPGRHGPLRRSADVAGHAQHPGPGVLQPGNQPLRAVHRRADLHRQVSHAARPAVLAVHVFAARFRRRVSLSGRQRRHAAGRGLSGPHSRGVRRRIAGARAGLRRVLAGHGAVDLRRQDLQHAQAGDVVQDRHRAWASCCSWRSSFPAPQTWREIVSGFFKFGTVPVQRGEDANGNGVLDPGEDWDGDGHLDVVEEQLPPTIDTDGDGKPDAWADIDGDGKPDKFDDVDNDGIRDGDAPKTFSWRWSQGRPFPTIDFSTIALLAAFAAIAGCGGLSNAPISNYTRDQGWGMGHHVGAIPSVDRRAQHRAVARGHGVPSHRTNRWCAGGAGIATCCAISWWCGCRPASWAWRCPACSRCSFCGAAPKSANGTPPA